MLLDFDVRNRFDLDVGNEGKLYGVHLNGDSLITANLAPHDLSPEAKIVAMTVLPDVVTLPGTLHDSTVTELTSPMAAFLKAMELIVQIKEARTAGESSSKLTPKPTFGGSIFVNGISLATKLSHAVSDLRAQSKRVLANVVSVLSGVYLSDHPTGSPSPMTTEDAQT